MKTPHLSPAAFCESKIHGWVPTHFARFLADEIGMSKGPRNVVINMPPRVGTSHVVSFGLPIWFLRHTHVRMLLVASGAAMASACRKRIQAEMGNRPLAASRLDVQPIGCSLVGHGYDVILVDDPHKNHAEAVDPLKIKETVEWIDNTARRRLYMGGKIVVCTPRFHMWDITAALGWETLALPALAGVNDPMGRKSGEALCPERWPQEKLAHMRDTQMSQDVWAAQWQQQPIAA